MKAFFGKLFNYFLGKHSTTVVASTLVYHKRRRDIDNNYFDYIRLSTLELISFEIRQKNISGAVAELGVYKGKFARYINKYFPDKKLYLFDTFEGFDEKDKKLERQKSFSNAEQDFGDTSVESVLNIMPYKKQCIVRKGYFPDTAVNIDEKFCFVSLDTDLYEPILNGLNFFYPRLLKGGYIMIHDFNNDLYPGVRKAVETFCEKNNIGYTPIADSAGTCIICK